MRKTTIDGQTRRQPRQEEKTRGCLTAVLALLSSHGDVSGLHFMDNDRGSRDHGGGESDLRSDAITLTDRRWNREIRWKRGAERETMEGEPMVHREAWLRERPHG